MLLLLALEMPAEVVLNVASLCVSLPEMESHPTDTVNSIAGRCTKVPKLTDVCHYLIFL